MAEGGMSAADGTRLFYGEWKGRAVVVEVPADKLEWFHAGPPDAACKIWVIDAQEGGSLQVPWSEVRWRSEEVKAD